jgi:hypothetical protein
MDDEQKDFLKRQTEYINLLHKITLLRLAGENPSNELIEEAHELGRAAQIPDILLRLL